MADERDHVKSRDETFALTCSICNARRKKILRRQPDGRTNACLFCWTCDLGDTDAKSA